MPYCTSYFKFLFEWFWGFPEQNKDFAVQNMGEGGYHCVSIAPSISSFLYFSFIDLCLWLFIYTFIHFIFLVSLFKNYITGVKVKNFYFEPNLFKYIP